MINQDFVRYIKHLWDTKTIRTTVRDGQIQNRMFCLYLTQYLRYPFFDWLDNVCTYEDLQNEFTEYEVIEIALYEHKSSLCKDDKESLE